MDKNTSMTRLHWPELKGEINQQSCGKDLMEDGMRMGAGKQDANVVWGADAWCPTSTTKEPPRNLTTQSASLLAVAELEKMTWVPNIDVGIGMNLSQCLAAGNKLPWSCWHALMRKGSAGRVRARSFRTKKHGQHMYHGRPFRAPKSATCFHTNLIGFRKAFENTDLTWKTLTHQLLFTLQLNSHI